MVKKIVVFMLVQCVISVYALTCWADNPFLTITGLVKHPLTLSVSDLNTFQAVDVQINDIDRAGKCRGAFNTRGIPLRHLLELCKLEKEDPGFKKPVDLAIAVTDASGKQVVLSWGEVFYKNSADVSIAFSAVPIIPHHGCSAAYAEQLHRKVVFPKLVIANDGCSDRSLEGIVNIEVIGLKPGIPFKTLKKLFSQEFSIVGKVKNTLAVNSLSPYRRTNISFNVVGEGLGFKGVRSYQGVSLIELLGKAGVEPDWNTVFLVSAPDGYRSLVSYGELYLSPHGKDIILADQEDGKPLDRDGKFMMVLPDDLFVDRAVRSVSMIEVISLK